MHLQQTKRGSRDTGGPQYFLHDLPDKIKKYLRKVGAVRVALITPYGATKSNYVALGRDHKLGKNLNPIKGMVGHDRIQQGEAGESIGESIRNWYRLEEGDFERIDVDIEIRDNAFYLTPLKFKYADRKTPASIRHVSKPLTFTREYQSPFWLKQMTEIQRKVSWIVPWCKEEFRRISKDHQKSTRLAHIQETDLLRASGPLRHLGMSLGGYVGKGYDCLTEFKFSQYPVYKIPVEIKKLSSGFKYQMSKYGKNELSRAVLLCATHQCREIPDHIDIIEIEALADIDLQNLG